MAFLIGKRGRITDFDNEGEEDRRSRARLAALRFQERLLRLISEAADFVKTDGEPREVWAVNDNRARCLIIVERRQRLQFMRDVQNAGLMFEITAETDIENLSDHIRQALPFIHRRYMEVS